MTNYRRNLVSGGTYFFAVNLDDRSQTLLTDHIEILRDAFRYVGGRHPFTLDAIVVLPDHLHAIWTMSEDDRNYPMRWRLIKTVFSRALPPSELVTKSRASKGERGIWQRRYWEHTIKDDIDYARHVDYIHINPVKHGYVSRAVEWPHSSFHRFVRAGTLAHDWAGAVEIDMVDFGERNS